MTPEVVFPQEVVREVSLQEQIEVLQRQLEQKQQQVRFAKFERRNTVETELRAAQEQLNLLDAELGRKVAPEPIVRRQRASMRGADGRKFRGGYGVMGPAATEAVRSGGGRPMTAGEVASAMNPPAMSERVATYLKMSVSRGLVRVSGPPRQHRYQWTGGSQ